ncbi:spermidine synthase [Archangium gephyra]|uniref:spermidine synthase n=1 Tax=Archangium gephyra TaxID=48 RepID=UPI003B76D5E2
MNSSSTAPLLEREAALRSGYYYALAWISGFNVMLLEMCAFRVLETEFGSSIYVTGVLLALVMIALSFGYYVGGKASTRVASAGYLLTMLGGAAVYVFLVNMVFAGAILDFCFGLRGAFSGPSSVNGIPPAVATVALYFLPMLALSQTSPFLIKLIASGPADARVGSVAGNLMAVSNIGSIAGTLLPTFVLIPRVGVEGTLYVFMSSLGIAVLAGAVLMGRAKRAVAFAVVLLLSVTAYGRWHADSATRGILKDSTVAYSGESTYGNIKILRSLDADGDEVFAFMPSRNYVHTYVYPERPLKEQFTTLHVSLGYARKAKNYLVLGTALGGVVASIVTMDPEAHVTAVEIDPALEGLARRFVPRLNHPNVNLVTEDARIFLRENTRQYDYIIVDVFAGQQIPAHCASQEFFALVHSRLTPDGVAVLNTNLWDFQIDTGLEEQKPFASVRHLHSALLHAGFASVFHNDFFEHGEVYAFKRPTGLEELRAALLGLVREATADTDLRASAAAAWLGVVPVAAERAEYRPITDEWVPEHELHLKENIEQYLGMLATASRHPEWKQVVEQAEPVSLRLLTARHYAELAGAFAPGWEGFKTYMKSDGGRRYCDALFRWADAHPGPLDRELARYFHASSASYCNEHAGSLDGTSRGARLLRTYLSAVEKLADNDSRGALPLLSDFIEQNGLMARGG